MQQTSGTKPNLLKYVLFQFLAFLTITSVLILFDIPYGGMVNWIHERNSSFFDQIRFAIMIVIHIIVPLSCIAYFAQRSLSEGRTKRFFVFILCTMLFLVPCQILTTMLVQPFKGPEPALGFFVYLLHLIPSLFLAEIVIGLLALLLAWIALQNQSFRRILTYLPLLLIVIIGVSFASIVYMIVTLPGITGDCCKECYQSGEILVNEHKWESLDTNIDCNSHELANLMSRRCKVHLRNVGFCSSQYCVDDRCDCYFFSDVCAAGVKVPNTKESTIKASNTIGVSIGSAVAEENLINKT